MAGQCGSRAETKSNGADFQEVYQLIRAHLPGVTDAELNQAAIQGLLTTFGPKVSLVTNGTSRTSSPAESNVSKSSMLESDIAYLRVARVTEGLAADARNVVQQFSATNKLKGLILDLRYTTGSDYGAAAATADLFVEKAQPLLNWGTGVVSAKEKSDAIQLPVAILVNSETAGAAEALAGILRSTGSGLVLGSRTAGRAMVSQDFPLGNGEQLRVASAPVTLGNGTTLSTNGVKPDIDVQVKVEDEREYYADAFYVDRKNGTVALGGASTNQAAATNASKRVRFNEAELVREHRAGLDRNTNDTVRAKDPEPDSPIVSDPALARAIDLLKGLAVVRQSRS
jgi:hypothetical protein